MISVLCWRWHTPGYRSTFGPETVNVLRKMVARNYPAPHRFICCSNDAVGIDREVEVVPDREDFAGVPSPHGGLNPSCFRRLRIFGPDAAATFGERIVSMDLDVVITADLRPVWDRPEDFVAWRDPLRPTQYNGSMMLLRAGSRPDVWARFDPTSSPREALAAGCKGSDQGWITYCLPGEATWGPDDGVYSYKHECQNGLPAGARVTVWHGNPKPWDAKSAGIEWVRKNYR